MLIDDFMPEYEFSERHERIVAAAADAVRRAVEEWQPRESILWRLLLRMRGLRAPAGSLRGWAESMGFLCLAETEDEVVYGLAGRFWSLRERDALAPVTSAEEFRAFDDPGSAASLFNLRVEPLTVARTRLVTETRIHALGPAARRSFRLYWLLIRPFSGLLRREMLRGIAARAERHVRAEQQSR
jgi:hypothetical protein